MTNIKTIHFKRRKEIDILRYDQLVGAANTVNIYCLSWYLDAVADHWGCLVKGDYEAVLPIPYTIKFGQQIIYQPFFTRELNVFSKQELNSHLVQEMFSAIPKEYRKVDFATSSLIDLEQFDRQEAQHQVLDLEGEYADIRASYSKNTKRLLNKAEKSGLTIDVIQEASDFITFFKTHTGKQVNYTPNNYQQLEALVQYIINHKKGQVLVVLEEGTIIAQGVFLHQGDKVTYLKGSVNERGKVLGAMFLLMDYVVRKSIEEERIRFDFGGSNIENIAAFYKKFGAKDRKYYRYSKNELSWILKKGKILRDFLKLS
ncbi:MAG: GNAT family N-acetyltransferase [Flavobacteriales bacterium]|jgi:lipid II:glycine glycyltransferase (peptidoglycan interpeptide bridge formation enzyme)|nr:GNAT family N-acetyltransferase [Flavobacteriales bacterium]